MRRASVSPGLKELRVFRVLLEFKELPGFVELPAYWVLRDSGTQALMETRVYVESQDLKGSPACRAIPEFKVRRAYKVLQVPKGLQVLMDKRVSMELLAFKVRPVCRELPASKG